MGSINNLLFDFSERKIKEDALHDVELLNCQQETLKSSIKDLENRLEKESENSATYQQEIKKISIQRDDYLVGNIYQFQIIFSSFSLIAIKVLNN